MDGKLGNSPSALRNKLLELHSEEWLRKQVCYLSDCQWHSSSLKDLHLPVPVYKEASPFGKFPKYQWFVAVYVRDVWLRFPAVLAAATSMFGSILKIDSTK